MKVKDVLVKVNEDVGFPLTMTKIKKAGHDPNKFLYKLYKEMKGCEDIGKYKKDMEVIERAIRKQK